MRILSRMVVLLALLFVPAWAQAKPKITLTPSRSTVAITQAQDFTAVITGTTTKNVKLQVCDANGANCVTGGNSTLGMLAEIGRDANDNPLVRYTAPAALPSSTLCQLVDTGCRLKLKAKLKGSTKKAFATATLTAPGVTGSPTGGGNGDSRGPARSANGRFLAFASAASNLPVPGGDTNGFQDVFLFDICLGATGCTPGLTIVSLANDGSAADGASNQPAISADGRFVTFVSSAANLLDPPGDVNGLPDVYVRDTCAGGDDGCVPSTIRVSEGSEADGFSDAPAVSANGRYIVFRSDATNLLGVGGDLNGAPDIFLRDTCIGAPLTPPCTPATLRVSEATGGAESTSGSDQPSVSADGRYVVFASVAANLAGGDTNGLNDIFLRDTCTGVTGCTPTTARVSVANDGSEASGGDTLEPVISGNGRHVVFRSAATNLIGIGNDNNVAADIFLRDTCLGGPLGCTPFTTRVSEANDGSEATGGDTLEPVMSRDGRFIAFRSVATNLVSGDGNSVPDIFVRDTCIGGEPGCTPSTRRISVTSSGGEAAAESFEPSLSGDGRFAAFPSDADLISGGVGAVTNIYLARTGVVIVPLAWVTNFGSNTVSVIDTETNTVIATIPVGNGPMGIALTPDGTRAYVTNFNDDTVSVIDTASRTVITTISVGNGPRGITTVEIAPGVYVTNNLSDTVSAISISSDQVFDTISLPVGAFPRGIVSGDDGVGTMNFGLNNVTAFTTDPGSPDFHTITDTFSVGDGPTSAAVRFVFPERVWVTNANAGTVSVVDVSVEPNVEIATINLGSGTIPAGAAVTPDGTRLYVAVTSVSGDGVVVINTANNSILKKITGPFEPQGVAVTPDGARVYVTNFGSNTVSVIDTATNAVVATIAVGTNPCCEQGVAIQFGRSN